MTKRNVSNFSFRRLRWGLMFVRRALRRISEPKREEQENREELTPRTNFLRCEEQLSSSS
jgi:hypothetical protein